MVKYLILGLLLSVNIAYGYNYDYDYANIDYIRRQKMETYQNLQVNQQQHQSFLLNNMNNSMNSRIKSGRRYDDSRRHDVEDKDNSYMY